LSLFAAEQLLSRFAFVRLLAQLQKLLTDLPVVVGLSYVDGPLAASENGSEQTALQDGSACDYDPRAETAGPTLLTGTSNNDRETMRDIIIAFHPPANARLEFCNQMRCFLRIGR
jgi:hypothetical protein